MSLLANSNAIESGGYNIDRSLRFRSSASAYLNRTPASTSNRKTWTWSGWVKRGALSQTGTIWGSNFSSGGFGLAFGNYGGVGVNPEYIGVTLYAVGTVTTNAVFRDPSAWYHIVAKFDSTQATQADRFALYVNGVKQTLSGTLNVTLNADYNVNLSGALHVLGGESGYYNDLYLAEVNFIDGQALTPSSFGETSSETGAWIPKKYTGTYGTNGFYLDFKNNTSATTLAYDKSGNGNNWTANNISTTAGATYDSMTDVPTLTSATAANFAVWNPLDRTAATYSEGNLKVVSFSAAAPYNMTASIAFPTTGKFYCEVTALVGGSNPLMGLGTNRPSDLISGYRVNGTYINNIAGASTSGTPSTYATNDIIGIAYDIDAGTLSFYKNGVAQSGGISGIPANGYFLCVRADSASGDGGYLNCGQRPFSYTPPTGFKALNTFNLPDPVIKKPNQYMDATTWIGNGAVSRTITNEAGFQPDFVWAKSRSDAYSHSLNDSSRGVGKQLQSDSTAAEITNNTDGYLSSFNSNGFSATSGGGINYYFNENSKAYVGWQWKESATSGFDIVTYTGNEVKGTAISHSLGVTPAMIVTKGRSLGGYDWAVYHKSLTSGYSIILNTTAAQQNTYPYFNSQAPTSSVFYLPGGSDANRYTQNKNGETYVAYLFAEIAGFSKFGSYTGNGSADGPFVYCGFRPKYVMMKGSSVASHWIVYDTARNTYNVVNNELSPNNYSAENGVISSGDNFDIVSNGFKVRGVVTNDMNVSGQTYIYAAFAESPFKTSNAR